MATLLAIEEESGTCTGRYHSHNGYYAGDFFTRRPASSSTELPRRHLVREPQMAIAAMAERPTPSRGSGD